MTQHNLCQVQYVTRYCALLRRDVEVVLIRRADGGWAPGRCLEKGKQCTGHECPLRMQDERWPFDVTWF